MFHFPLSGSDAGTSSEVVRMTSTGSSKTRSGPKIPAAGYLEGEGFFGFKDIDSDFGCCYEQFWNFVRTTEFWNFVRTTEFWLFSRSWIFGLLALKMALKVNSDHRFEFFGFCSLCEHGFFTSKAMFRQFLTFCYKKINRKKPRVDLLPQVKIAGKY